MVAPVLAVLCPFLVLAGLVGVYEWRCYTAEERARAPAAARAKLAVWLATILTGVAGIALVVAGADLTWAAYYPLLAVAVAAPLVDLWFRRRSGVDRSPIVDRFLST